MEASIFGPLDLFYNLLILHRTVYCCTNRVNINERESDINRGVDETRLLYSYVLLCQRHIANIYITF